MEMTLPICLALISLGLISIWIIIVCWTNYQSKRKEAKIDDSHFYPTLKKVNVGDTELYDSLVKAGMDKQQAKLISEHLNSHKSKTSKALRSISEIEVWIVEHQGISILIAVILGTLLGLFIW
ncbi:hypothetical protein ACPV5V_19510 [Vibrio campbellii]